MSDDTWEQVQALCGGSTQSIAVSLFMFISLCLYVRTYIYMSGSLSIENLYVCLCLCLILFMYVFVCFSISLVCVRLYLAYVCVCFFSIWASVAARSIQVPYSEIFMRGSCSILMLFPPGRCIRQPVRHLHVHVLPGHVIAQCRGVPEVCGCRGHDVWRQELVPGWAVCDVRGCS